MTTYGTIPTSSSPSTEYISRAKDSIKSNLAARRPWKQTLNIRALSFPRTLQEAISRVRTNTAFFRTNYAIIILLILFLSLLWHPVSLIVFIIMMALWLFLYFLRDEPLVVFGRVIDDRVVLLVMVFLTLLFLFLTDATVNILVALLIGVVVVVVHAAVRKTDDVFVDEEGGESQGLISTGGGGGLPSSSS